MLVNIDNANQLIKQIIDNVGQHSHKIYNLTIFCLTIKCYIAHQIITTKNIFDKITKPFTLLLCFFLLKKNPFLRHFIEKQNLSK